MSPDKMNSCPTHSRRDFLKLSAAGLAAVILSKGLNQVVAVETPAAPSGKPDSKVAGVQLGLNVPYSFGNPKMSGDDILKNCVLLGFSGVELRTQPVEAFLGAPADAPKELPA